MFPSRWMTSPILQHDENFVNERRTRDRYALLSCNLTAISPPAKAPRLAPPGDLASACRAPAESLRVVATPSARWSRAPLYEAVATPLAAVDLHRGSLLHRCTRRTRQNPSRSTPNRHKRWCLRTSLLRHTSRTSSRPRLLSRRSARCHACLSRARWMLRHL